APSLRFPSRRSSDLYATIQRITRPGDHASDSRCDLLVFTFTGSSITCETEESNENSDKTLKEQILARLAFLMLASISRRAGTRRSEEHTSELQSPDH